MRVALLAAFFLAVLYPAVHFSRFGMRAMLFVPVETMAVACFWWAVNRPRTPGTQGDFRESGSYSSPPAFLLAWASISLPPRDFSRWSGCSLFPSGSGGTARRWPTIGGRFWPWPEPRLAHCACPCSISLPVTRITLSSGSPYVANKGKGAVEGRPYLDLAAEYRSCCAWTFLAGRNPSAPQFAGTAVFRPHPGRPVPVGPHPRRSGRSAQPRYLFLLIWFGVMLLPSILSGDAPHFGRLVRKLCPGGDHGGAGRRMALAQCARCAGPPLSPAGRLTLPWPVPGCCSLLACSAYLDLSRLFRSVTPIIPIWRPISISLIGSWDNMPRLLRGGGASFPLTHPGRIGHYLLCSG